MCIYVNILKLLTQILTSPISQFYISNSMLGVINILLIYKTQYTKIKLFMFLATPSLNVIYTYIYEILREYTLKL